MLFKRLLICLLVVFYLGACTSKTAEEYLAEAKASMAQNELRKATVLLKNSLQQQPENPETRFLLGSIYNRTGAAAEAEKELTLAYKYGHEADEVLPILARSLILQYKNKELVELVDEVYASKKVSDEIATALLAYQAQSYLNLGQSSDARQAIETASNIASDSMYTRLGDAYLQLDQNKYDEAIAAADRLLISDPYFADALFLKGQLAYRTANYVDAVLSFEKYHALQPEVIQGRVLLADSYIRNKEFDKARTQVNYLLRAHENYPFFNQLDGQIKYAKNNFTEAKAAAEKAIQFGGDNNVTRAIAGVSSYRLGLEEQAYQHLVTLENKLPESNRLISLLSLIKLNLGYDENLEGIESLSSLQDTDLSILLNSAGRLVQQGRLNDVKKVVDSIDSSKVTDPLELTKLSMLKLGIQDKSGIKDLEQVLASNPEANMAKAVLAKAYLAEGRHEEAIDLAKSTITSAPDKTDGYNLTGYLLEKLGRKEEAQSYFEQALEIDPNNSQTYLFLGQQAIGEKNWEAAKKQYSALLQLRPVHLPALNTYYKIQKLHGDPALALQAAETIYKEQPNNNKYALIYAKLLESEREFDKAIAVLDDITPEDALPNAFWQLNYDLLLRVDDDEQALQKITEWTRFKPTSELAWRTLATFHESQGDIPEASKQVKNGLSVAKGNKDNLKVLNAQYSIMLDDVDEAEKTIEELEAQYETNPVVSLLMGQLKMKEGNCEEAIPLLKVNYEHKPSSRVLKNLLSCYVKLDQQDQALNLATNHLTNSEDDASAKLLLANLHQSKNPKIAIGLYEEVISTKPNNVVALNNLSWLYLQIGERQKALNKAELALKEAPKSHIIFDTYGDALASLGRTGEAVEAYSKAYILSERNNRYAQKYVDALKSDNQHQLANKISLEANL